MNWASAFAKQAKSDLEAREQLLLAEKLPQCHQLHFLQMACEKLCKAYLIGAQRVDHLALSSSHAYVAKQLPLIARQFLARDAGRLPRETWVLDPIRELARRIELLAPAVTDGGRVPANCEYPWEAPDGTVVAPAEHNFGLIMLYERAGTTLLKVLRIAAEELSQP